MGKVSRNSSSNRSYVSLGEVIKGGDFQPESNNYVVYFDKKFEKIDVIKKEKFGLLKRVWFVFTGKTSDLRTVVEKYARVSDQDKEEKIKNFINEKVSNKNEKNKKRWFFRAQKIENIANYSIGGSNSFPKGSKRESSTGSSASPSVETQVSVPTDLITNKEEAKKHLKKIHPNFQIVTAPRGGPQIVSPQKVMAA